MSVEREIRPQLRDYVKMLLYMGMRHGTEATCIRWKDFEWHTKIGVRYLRVWIDGKTGAAPAVLFQRWAPAAQFDGDFPQVDVGFGLVGEQCGTNTCLVFTATHRSHAGTVGGGC